MQTSNLTSGHRRQKQFRQSRLITVFTKAKEAH